jgi:hypothetical protein
VDVRIREILKARAQWIAGTAIKLGVRLMLLEERETSRAKGAHRET